MECMTGMHKECIIIIYAYTVYKVHSLSHIHVIDSILLPSFCLNCSILAISGIAYEWWELGNCLYCPIILHIIDGSLGFGFGFGFGIGIGLAVSNAYIIIYI